MSTRLKPQRGFIASSLPELAFVLVILGLLIVTATTVVRDTQKVANTTLARTLFQKADAAVNGFIYANGRLPCPAAVGGSGNENCGLTDGVLPTQTLGMASVLRNQAGLELRYSVYAKPGATTLNAELNKKLDRIQPYYATYTSAAVGAPQDLGNATDMDLCRAVAIASDAGVDANYVHTRNASAQKQHIAYVIVDPGVIDADKNAAPVSLFDGVNPSGVGFELPSLGLSAGYDDQVHTVYFDNIWEKMGCSGILAPVGHAHPNVKSTTALLRQELRDYKKVLEIAKKFADYSHTTAAALDLQAGAGLATAASLIPAGTATTLLMAPVGPYVTGPAAIGLAVAAIVVNTAGVVAAALNHSYLSVNLIPLAQKMVDLCQQVINVIDSLDVSIDNNVKAADSAGIYER